MRPFHQDHVYCSTEDKTGTGIDVLRAGSSQTKPPLYVLAEINVKDEEGYKIDFLSKVQANIKAAGGV
jgi:hypothetical protein